MTAPLSVMHQWARFYAGLGWHIFPLVPGTKSPFAGSHGSSEATADLARIDAWWSANPDANIGIKPSAAGLYVFDVDPRNGGSESFAQLQTQHGVIDSPLAVDSPGGGFHLYFAAKADTRYSGAPATGIDGKFNGYAVLPPSLHPNGQRYAWRNGPQAVAAAAPDWLVSSVGQAKPSGPMLPGSLAEAEKIALALSKLTDPDDYTGDNWRAVGAAIKEWADRTEGGDPVGLKLWDDWSQKDPDPAQYDPDKLEWRWHYFKSDRAVKVTLGTLFRMAGMTAEQQMIDATKVFASLPPAEQADRWTTESKDPFPTTKTPLEVVTDFSQKPEGAFRKAWESGDWVKVARQLAWKLGSNCEAVLEGLKIGGAEDSPDLRAFVVAACESVTEWASGDSETLAALPAEVTVLSKDDQFYGAERQAEIFKGCAFVSRQGRIVTPRGELYEQLSFNAVMPSGVYTLDYAETKTKKPWEAFVSSQVLRHPRVDDVTFRPDLAPGCVFAEEGAALFNIYQPYPAPRRVGDPAPFLHHIALMVPDERDRQILLTWMAAVVQHPGRKFRWAPVLQGWEGNGKGLLQDTMQRAVGRKYTHLAQAGDIGNKFNAWLVGKLLVCVSEMNSAGDVDVIDALKPMVSDDYVATQGKGTDQTTARNFANFMFSTNRAGAMGKAVEGRRYAVFYTAQQTAEDVKRDMPNAYFVSLIKWLESGGHEIAIDYLATMPLAAEFNPAGLAVDAPRTSSFEASKLEALGAVEQAILEAVAEGREGFRGGFVSGLALGDLLEGMRKANAIPSNRRRGLMQSIGYDWHPALKGGRSTRAIGVKGLKPVLFVKKGHPLCERKDGSGVMDKFEEAQRISPEDSIFRLKT